MHQTSQLIAHQITSATPQADPHWTAYVTAVVVPVIALIAAWIAFRQWQIARNKLKLDLYDKRMAVCEVVRKTLGVAQAKYRRHHVTMSAFVLTLELWAWGAVAAYLRRRLFDPADGSE